LEKLPNGNEDRRNGMIDEGCPGIRAMLQAGGKGTRLYPATADLPKPLLRVGGVPLLERLLRQVFDSGIRDVTIITGWLGEQVRTHVEALHGIPKDAVLQFVQEPRQLGNIGGLALVPRKPEPILFAFGDLLTDLDFRRLISLHRETRSDITLTSHYEQHRLTLGELIVEDERVVGYKEKPIKNFLICSGIAVFEPCVLDLIDLSVATGISDLISAAIAASLKVTHWTHGAFWMDINTPELMETAERQLALRSAAARS
jgi:NDP-sugar pyrophosphorylase family protein